YEFERSDTRAAGEGEYRTRQWLQVRRHFSQSSSKVGRSLFPEGKELRTDNRPILYILGRRRKVQGAGGKLAREVSQALDQAQSKPGCRADDDPKRYAGYDGGGQFRSIAKMLR